ncbi:MAG: twin-arginine translocase subunit TatC [Alistipes sp.]
MSDQVGNRTDEMSFGEHLDALRPHLMRICGVFFLLLIASFCFKEILVDTLLFGPMKASFPTNQLFAKFAEMTGIAELNINAQTVPLINTSLSGQFNLHLKIAMLTAFTLGFPYLLWEVWRFVKPALSQQELSGCRQFVFYVSLCFFIGLSFGYFIIAPLTINFLAGYSVSTAISNLIDVNSYLATVIDVSLACAVVFQLPLCVYFLTRMGILTSTFLKHYRRHAVVVLALLSAIITPPDVFSMILVLLPLYGLYEYSISLSTRVEHRYFSNS